MKARATQFGYARDLAGFLSFVWSSREGRLWRDATEADHLAYLTWRRRDPDGPRVDGATWNREVAGVDAFYRWAVQDGCVAMSPIPQVARRRGAGAGWVVGRWTSSGRRRTCTAFPGSGWSGCRRWRDVGVRGFDAAGGACISGHARRIVVSRHGLGPEPSGVGGVDPGNSYLEGASG
ncbi:site-specific integrase [Streptomyces niveus]|uniref:site-specific integrase n=1 Tax=Streptomyces niveus TaxID=193462 RepID=UPI003676BEC9